MKYNFSEFLEVAKNLVYSLVGYKLILSMLDFCFFNVCGSVIPMYYPNLQTQSKQQFHVFLSADILDEICYTSVNVGIN